MRALLFSSWTWTVLTLASLCIPMDAKEDAVISSVIETKMLRDAQPPPSGAQLRHEKLSEEKIREKYGKEASDKLLHADNPIQGVINLHATGIQPGDRYTLYTVNALHNKTVIAEFVADRKGLLNTIKDGVPLSGFDLIQFDLMNGEAIYFVLASASKKSCLPTQIIMDPIEFAWADGAYLYALLTTKDASLFTFIGKGFQPNEQLVVVSESGKEVVRSIAKTDDNGRWHGMTAPGVKGMRGGPASLSIQRSDTGETGKLSYLWGDAAKARARNPIKKI